MKIVVLEADAVGDVSYAPLEEFGELFIYEHTADKDAVRQALRRVRTGRYRTSRGRGCLLMTPHMAWTGLEARERLVQGVADNIREWLRDC